MAYKKFCVEREVEIRIQLKAKKKKLKTEVFEEYGKGGSMLRISWTEKISNDKGVSR